MRFSRQLLASCVLSLVGLARVLAQEPAPAQPRAADESPPAVESSTPAPAQLPAPAAIQGRVIDLDYALNTAKKHAPELRQAAATTAAAHARIGIARSPLLPQVTGTASYTLSASNGTSYNISTNTLAGSRNSNFESANAFAAGVRATQLIYDFGQTWNLTEAAKDNARSQEQNERTTQLQISYTVRTSFLTAGANRALVEVAHATLSNQERHMMQIKGFVDVGTRPPIDLAQAKTDVATARLDVLRSENNYAASKAELSRSMGVPSDTAYEVSDQLPGPEEYEDNDLDDLVKRAEVDRPEFSGLRAQLLAQEANLRSIKGQYGPSLGLTGSFDETGNQLSNMATRFGIGVGLTWPIFQGGLTNGRVDEGNAIMNQLNAQFETLQQDLRVALTQAQLSLRAAEAALVVADELVQLAKERLTLADGRYQTGVGNIIELGDAELALRDAQTQRVTAAYDLATARALLHRTLGRM